MELHIISKERKTAFILLDKNMKLIKPVGDYLDYQLLRGRAENTLKAYARDLKVFFGYLESKNLHYDEISIGMIRDYVEYLRSPIEGETFLYVESKRAPATINRMIGTLYGFYCYQSAMHGIVNPILMKEISSPNSVFRGILYHTRKNNYTQQSIFKIKESGYRIHLFTPDEIQNMWLALPTARDKLIFKLLIQTGARIGEILALRIENVPIPDSSNAVSVIHNVKSKGCYRDIYIPTDLLSELDAYIIEFRSTVKAMHSYIFTSQHPYHRNRPVSYRGLYGVFKRVGEKIGIDFKFHDTRHTFVTRLVESGMDFSVVRMLAGHKHITTTQKYVTLSTEYIAKSLARYWACSAMLGGETHE
jgi:site-specific recombinase XerD